MNFLKKLGCAAAVAFAAGTVQASPVMNDWTFNPIGGGMATGIPVNEYLDVNGNAFIQITATGTNSFSFTEHGAFNLVQADSNGGLLFPMNYTGGNISATLEARGTGTFNGAFTFTGGTIRMYQNPTNEYGTTKGMYGANRGKLIGEFSVLAGGGGLVDASGNPTGNGQVSIRTQFKAGDLEAGYFFADNGVDMSTVSGSAFAMTNANTTSKATANMVKEIACQFGGYVGPGCTTGTYANMPANHFFVSNNGQFKFSDIPEPGSVALFGIALFGIGALRRRVK